MSATGEFMKACKWRWFTAGGVEQVRLDNGEDIANLAFLDRKHFMAMSMPVSSVRLDRRMLEFMDSDGDGRIRISDVVAAVDFLKSKNVDLNSLFTPSKDDAASLEAVMAKRADLAAVPPSEGDVKALSEWAEKGRSPEIAVLGDSTAEAVGALAAVEKAVDAFFALTEDVPLVMEEPDKTLPLDNRINPVFRQAFADLREKCVKGVLGDVDSLDVLAWERLKEVFAPYRAHQASKPVVNAGLVAKLDDEERLLRYKMGLLEFLENFVNMRRLYAKDSLAMFLTGTLRIDAREMLLCFDVENEAAHSALSGRSNCCVIYLKLTRPAAGKVRTICAVVTRGAISRLYPGRNGVFHDRDGLEWEAVITKVVENQVSLLEAFWLPWKKMAEGVSSMTKKFLGDKQATGQMSHEKSARSVESSGATLASSVAAVGIGIGMLGAAAASVMAALSGMSPLRLALSFLALLLVVSLPSVVLTWFKLRRRDIGAILNACGWAVNRPMAFSMKRAADFTRGIGCRAGIIPYVLAAALIAVIALCGYMYCSRGAGVSSGAGAEKVQTEKIVKEASK